MIPLITIATHTSSHRGLDPFLASCQRFDVEPVRLGRGQKWKGCGQKPKLLHAYLVAHPEVDEFMWLDAYDCVLQRPLQDALNVFRCCGKPLFFSAEKNVWPDPALVDQLPPSDTPYRGVCAGAWMGKRDAAIAMFEESGMLQMRDDDPATDQLPTQRYVIAHPELCAVDHLFQVFGSLYMAADDFAYGSGIVSCHLTSTTPIAIHGNGQADMTATYRALSL